MPDILEYHQLYIDIAKRIAKLSKAERLQVGALVVYNNAIVSYGYNGTPTKHKSNVCENNVDGKLVTKPTVIHAELNALLKLLKSGFKVEKATLYLTHSPCIQCSIHIYQSGIIEEVVYDQDYRDTEGIDFLDSHGIYITKYKEPIPKA